MASASSNEDAIAKVEGEIDEVKAKINNVEAKLEAATTDKEEKAALRKKEEQLNDRLNKWIDQLTELRKQKSSTSDSGKS